MTLYVGTHKIGAMTKEQAIKHFGTQQALADALGVRSPTISGWRNGIPHIHQLRLERMTRRKLKADPSVWGPKGIL